MASGRLLLLLEEDEERREVQEEIAKLDFCHHKHSLLIVVGRSGEHGHAAGHIDRDIERGLRSWDIDLNGCNLNLYLQEFLSHHTASFKGAGQKCLRHSTKTLDTQVLISPTQEQVHAEVFSLLSRDSAHKLLILAGQSLEESGDLLFHQGLFSPHQLKEILHKQFLGREGSSSNLRLTLSCPNIGGWRQTLLGLRGPYSLHINPPEVHPAMDSVGDFSALVSNTISPMSHFELLPPPSTVGFLKLSRPCCYVFPAGRGDCAFFAVNGFTVLVDGGSESQACFWKLVRHLDRVDAVLLTHIGTENLPGVNAFLQRKVSEQELRAEVKEDSSKRLISPELGVVFFNAPNRLQPELHNVDNVLKSTQQGALTMQLLKKLDIRPQPMVRPNTAPVEPMTLFQKMGVGQLDLYIISPGKNSQEYQTFMQNWPDAVSSASKSQALPLTALASVCALLVWHPACPQEKVVRVLFPGVTPQAKLIQGLEKLKGLAFLQKSTVTAGDLEHSGEEKKGKRADSQDSVRSVGKDLRKIIKTVKEDAKEKGKIINGVDKPKKEPKKPPTIDKNTLKKKDIKSKEESKAENNVKKELAAPKAKTDNKTKLKKDAKNDSKTAAKKSKKPSVKEVSGGKKVEAEVSNKTKLDITKQENVEEKHEKVEETEDQPSCSKISTPEDMTEEFMKLQEEETEREAVQVEKCDSAKQTENGPRKALEDADGAKQEEEESRLDKDKSGETVKPAKVAGFPSPLKNEPSVPQDLTPTEYTLLDGALQHSPQSKSSPENQAPVSLEEATVEQTSTDSRPNSAGHTPYCLSPDDVWGNRSALSRIQMGSLESGDTSETKEQSEKTKSKEKHLSFMTLGTLKEVSSDPSPSLTTTTTTHSMPAEVSSPQSTEVDESLSMSFEQGPSQKEGDDSITHHSNSNGGHFVGLPMQMKKPARSVGSEMSRTPNSLHLETSPHDVDLCLVSPCEFKHFKASDSAASSEPSKGCNNHHSNNNNHKDASPSESNAPLGTEDCPSTTADAVLDSDEDDSCSEGSNSPRDVRPGLSLPPDPLPVPQRDSPPLPPLPDTTMPIPQSESDAQAKRAKAGGMKGKKSGVVESLQKSSSTKSRNQSSAKESKENLSSSRTLSSSPKTTSTKPSPNPAPKPASVGEVSVYVDLAYIPSGASTSTVSVDFFRCVRSSCYIVSGDAPEREGLMRQTLDALLDGKSSWSDPMQVTVIPTFESVSMQEWYQQTLERQRDLNITVLGSNSTVAMQDETFPACKIEF